MSYLTIVKKYKQKSEFIETTKEEKNPNFECFNHKKEPEQNEKNFFNTDNPGELDHVVKNKKMDLFDEKKQKKPLIPQKSINSFNRDAVTIFPLLDYLAKKGIEVWDKGKISTHRIPFSAVTIKCQQELKEAVIGCWNVS